MPWSKFDRDLYTAACKGDLHAMEKALKAGAEVNAQCDIDDQTALHGACAKYDPKPATWLIAKGARLDLKDEWGHTPLDLARQGQNLELISLLENATASGVSPQLFARNRMAASCETWHRQPSGGGVPEAAVGRGRFPRSPDSGVPEAAVGRAKLAEKIGEMTKAVSKVASTRLTLMPCLRSSVPVVEVKAAQLSAAAGRKRAHSWEGSVGKTQRTTQQAILPANLQSQAAAAQATGSTIGSSRTGPSFSVEAELSKPSTSREMLEAAFRLLYGAAPRKSMSTDELRQALRNELVGDGAATAVRAATSWEGVLEAAWLARCVAFLRTTGMTEVAAVQRAQKEKKKRPNIDQRMAIWRDLQKEFGVVSADPPPRRTKRLLIIGPGFGTAQGAGRQYLEVVDKYPNTVDLHPPNDFSQAGLDMLTRAIMEADKAGQPFHAILSASKGGVYMIKLWQLMADGKLPKLGCLMINAYPLCFPRDRNGIPLGFELPKDVPIVIAHGQHDGEEDHVKAFKRERGYDEDSEVQRGTLEALIRTGSPIGKCFLYYTRDQPSGFGNRIGDGHNLVSIYKNDCLARLIDSITFTSGEMFKFTVGTRLGGGASSGASEQIMPGFTFPCSNLRFLSQRRLEAEKRLGYHPGRWFQDYVHKHGRNGKDPQKRFEVARDSQEFEDVAAIFLAQSQSSRFYHRGEHQSLHDHIKKDKLIIERVENAGQEGELDFTSSNLAKQLRDAGSEVIPGAHTRWLFHGTDNDGLKEIIAHPSTGFNATGSWVKEGLWGKGIYFARDAEYSVHGPYARAISDKRDDKKMILLCLVECGLPCLGERFMGPASVPRVHPKSSLLYTTLVDDYASPEIFASPANYQAYPAYVIHFPRSFGYRV